MTYNMELKKYSGKFYTLHGYTHTMLIPNGTAEERASLRLKLALFELELGPSNNTQFPKLADRSWFSGISPFTYSQRLLFMPDVIERVESIMVEHKLKNGG